MCQNVYHVSWCVPCVPLHPCVLVCLICLHVYIRGFEKFFMERAYSWCQSDATKMNYFNSFEINFDSKDDKIAKENQILKWFEFCPSSKLF